MTEPRQRPAFTADERTQLVGWLNMQRDVVRWKCRDVSEEDAHRAVLPASPLMTLAGLVSHLRWVEHLWFEVLFLDLPSRSPDLENDDDMRVSGVPLGQLLAEYEQQCVVSDRIVAAHSLDDTGRSRKYASGGASLRWMLLHMIEETARHAGHADAVRELLDGETGYY